jgi:hypothetical protein
MSELCQAVKSGVHSNPAVFMLHFMAVMGNTEVVGTHQVYHPILSYACRIPRLYHRRIIITCVTNENQNRFIARTALRGTMKITGRFDADAS